MRNPVYFNYGIAVHGAFQVPQYPASHGCIRIDNSFSEHFQSIVAVGEPVFVWDGVEEPEVYGGAVRPVGLGRPQLHDDDHVHDDDDHRGADHHARGRPIRPPRRRRRRPRRRRPPPRRRTTVVVPG